MHLDDLELSCPHDAADTEDNSRDEELQDDLSFQPSMPDRPCRSLTSMGMSLAIVPVLLTMERYS